MPDNSAAFEIIFKTIADATGVTQMRQSLETLTGQVQGFASGINRALSFVGLSLGIEKLNEYGNKALEVGEKTAAFTLAILRSKDGSHQLVEELTTLNEELAKTTGTSPGVARSIEQLYARAGASADQIKELTKGTIEFAASSAGTVEPVELASIIARRLGTTSEEASFSLRRLGINAKTAAELITELKTKGGESAEAIAAASGGMKQYDLAVEHLEQSIGRLVNLLRIPFLTTLDAETEDSRSKIDAASKSYTDFGATIVEVSAASASVVANLGTAFKLAGELIYYKAGEMLAALRSLVTGTLSIVSETVEAAVVIALDAINNLVQGASSALSTISGGKISIDTSGFETSIGKIEEKAAELGKSVRKSLDESGADAALKSWKQSADEADASLQKVLDAPTAAAAKAKAAYKEFTEAISGLTGTPGSGVIDPSDVNKAAAAKAATEALTEAKYQLSAAQQTYETELEATKALEEAGAITVEQGDQQRRVAILDYINKLNQVKAILPSVIALEERAGNFKGVAEVKLLNLELDKTKVKAEAALGNTTFFGKIHSQLTQLKNDWSDLGKQIGGFLTQQFTAFANTAGQAIAGLIFRTTSWKDAILQLGESFVAQLATMLIQWVLARTVISALNKAFGAGDAAATNAQAASAAAAWGPAATAASIASFGAASGAGLAAYLAALGIGTSSTVAAASVGGVGFALGGLTPGTPTFATVGEQGPEFVFSNPAVQALGAGFLDNLHRVAISSPKSASGAAGSLGSGAGSGRSAGGDANHFYFFTDKDAMHRHFKSNPANKKLIIDWINQSGGHLRT